MTIPDPDGRIADMQARAERFTHRVEQIRGKGTRMNGRLIFEVDAQKNPVRVSVDDGIEQYKADSIAELFQGAARDACQDVDRQIQEALLEFGDDQKTRDLVKELMGPFNPRASSEPTAPQWQEPHDPDPEDDESWNDMRSWMGKT